MLAKNSIDACTGTCPSTDQQEKFPKQQMLASRVYEHQTLAPHAP